MAQNRTKRAKKQPSGGRKAITALGKWKGVFLGVLAETGNATTARKAAKIAKETLWSHKAKDAAFAQAWAEALDEAADVLEGEAWRRGKDGFDVPVTCEGELAFVAIDSKGQYVPKDVALIDSGPSAGKPKPGFKLIPFVKKQYSDGLLQLLLKAARPAKFGDKVQLTRNDGDGPEQIVLVQSAPPAPAPAAK